ncbi:MAG: hypothetical protein AAFY41_18455 [Bacteroidota bacterium]
MSRLLKVSQLQGDVCPKCGSINQSKITRTGLSTRIGNHNYGYPQGLVKRSHSCDACGYTGRDNDDGDIPFNTIAVREDHLQQLLILANTFLLFHQKASKELVDSPLLNLTYGN